MIIMRKVYKYVFISFFMEERHRTLLIKQNPQWENKKLELPKFERNLIKKLERYIAHKQIIAIMGLRRVGKTIIMKQIMSKLDVPEKNACYISFDDIDFQKYTLAEELINYFLEFSVKTKKRYLFLDEIQKLANWQDLLKVYYDSEENLKIFISGSASLEIKKSKETLAGRLLTFHLPIFTFKEFVRYHGMESEISGEKIQREYDIKFLTRKENYENLFRDYLIKGAFPELLKENDWEFIRKYIQESVIEKTITDISKITNSDEKEIYELFKLLNGSNAQLFEITNLSNILKINRNIVSYYLSLLEKSFLIKIVYNFTSSISKQVRASKKQHCAHSSIVISSLGYPFEIINTEVSGRLVESVIANSIEEKISFWRTAQKDEVDIVLNEKNFPIEVKYQSQITNNDFKPILKFLERFKAKMGVLITKNIFDIKKIDSKEILLIPAWLFLLLDDYGL